MCGCSSSNAVPIQREMTQEQSKIINKWILDNLGRELLVIQPIWDTYNDIIGYITKKSTGEIVRIFAKNVKEILEK